jgi:prepilin-type N-terminal cleavage/methylation domain-containing protein
MPGCRDLTIPHRSRGFTVLEVLLSVAIGATLISIAVPLSADALDEARTAMAARYLEGRIMEARMEAIRRSTAVALRFEAVDGDYRFGEYLDGNGNGVRTADITAGIDRELTSREFLRDRFSRVSFGLAANIPDLDNGASGRPTDGLRLGAARILTLTPDSTSSSGTMYVRGRRAQYAVRILGVTGRARVLRFEPGSRQWIAR